VPQDTGNATDQSEPPPKSRERYERDQDGLTFKQRQFVIAMLKGSTASDAYRASYDAAKMKPSTVHEAASRLMLNSKISARLDAGFRRLEENALHSAASHRRLIEERLVALAQDADTDAASIRAIELLGKLENVGAFRERLDVTSDQDQAPEDLEQALQARLADLFAKAG
jgi:phage terminase small subunit